MLSNLPVQLGSSALKRHLLFLFATIFTVLLIGYQYGTFDEAMHIPFLKALVNPALYKGDTLLSLHNIYYSYFWFFFIPFLKLGWLEPSLFVVHIISIYLSYWAIWELSATLFQDHRSSFISVIAFIVPHFSFVGFPVFEFAPLSRTVVLPFLLIAMNQFLKGRWTLAFFISGLMCNVHIVSVNFVVAMFGLACLMELYRGGIRNFLPMLGKRILPGVVLFVIAALPVIMWKANGSPVDLSLRPEWVNFLNQSLFRHIFAMVGSYPVTWFVVGSGLSTLALFFIAFPRQEKQTIEQMSSSPITTARYFIFAGIVVLLVNIITVNLLPVTIVIESQIARIGLWILIIAYLFFANLLARLFVEDNMPRALFWLLFITFIFSPTAILPLILWLLMRNVKNPTAIKAGLILAPISILFLYFLFFQIGFWDPGIYIYGKMSPWVDVQLWAKQNTSIEARFITPPEKWGVIESDWRVYSERASAATLSELLVAAFQPGYEIGWKTRFEMVAPGALARFNGEVFEVFDVTRQAYLGLSAEKLSSAACALDAQYIVTEKPAAYPFFPVYENTNFIVYDVSKTACK